MMKIRLHNLLASLGLAASLTVSLQAQVYPLSENSWSNPEFRERFMGTYGVDTDYSPSITPAEKALFDEIVPLVSSNPRAAIARLQTGITSESSAAFDFILANLQYQENDMTGAVRAYEAAIRKFPNYYRAYFNAGRAYVSLGNYERGLTMLQKALELKPGDGSLYGLIGYCYLNREEFSTALDAYRMAVMLAPGSRDWKLGKLKSYEALGMTDETIAMLYEFMKADPENADWWKLQANQFIARGEPLKAAANLSILKDMGKADGSSLVLLGDVLLNEELFAPALESYELALGKENVRIEKILYIVDNLIQFERADYGMQLLTKAEETTGAALSEKDELSILNLKAKIALVRDEREAATGYLEEVVNRDPMNGTALLSLARYYADDGDDAKAEFYAENAAELEAYAHPALLALARLKVKQRNYREAAQHLRQAQAIDPRDYVADYLMKVEQAALRM